MEEQRSSEVDRLIKDHWAYVKGVLERAGTGSVMIEIEYHYKTAFWHGFKHGFEANPLNGKYE